METQRLKVWSKGTSSAKVRLKDLPKALWKDRWNLTATEMAEKTAGKTGLLNLKAELIVTAMRTVDSIATAK